MSRIITGPTDTERMMKYYGQFYANKFFFMPINLTAYIKWVNSLKNTNCQY